MEGSTTPKATDVTRRPFSMAIALAGVAVFVALGLFLSTSAGHIWWEVVTLGIIEGLTEFLPISSTAHLLITADLLRFPDSIGGTFEIFIQLGAILAVVLYYARDVAAQARALPASPPTRRFWLGILIAFLPAALSPIRSTCIRHRCRQGAV